MPAARPTRRPRAGVASLTDIPNIGKAMASDLLRLRITRPEQLAGRDPLALYASLCRRTGARHDPCVIDAFMAAVDSMNGAAARPWWEYTAQRKKLLAGGGAPRRSRGKRN
jgi:hypothetical protein